MKTKLLLKTTLLALASTQLIACSRGTVDSNLLTTDASGNNQIYRSYRISHKEALGKTMANATFSLDGSWGTTVKLMEPSRIEVNGQQMYADEDVLDGGEVAAFYMGFLFPLAWFYMGDNGTHYYKSLNQQNGPFTFTWIDPQGRAVVDTIEAMDVQLLTPNYVYQDRDLTLHIAGYEEGSTVYVRIGNKTGVQKHMTFYDSSPTISQESLAELQKGTLQLQVEVTGNQSLPSQGNNGGDITYSYHFSERVVELR